MLTFCQHHHPSGFECVFAVGKKRGLPSGSQRQKGNAVEYLGFTDLLARWIYTRQGLYKVMARDGFPSPVFAINRGRTRVWDTADITAYERAHPELTSETAKHRKIVGYAIGNFKKNARGGAPRPAAG